MTGGEFCFPREIKEKWANENVRKKKLEETLSRKNDR